MEGKPPVTITASMPLLHPPAWAVLQRQLIDEMSRSVCVYLAAYTHGAGSRIHELIWGDALPSRDGADDFYEAFYNWPLLYVLGGADDLLPLAHQQWEATTRQLTRMGMLTHEYERGYDQFHQSEGNLFFYFLCLADPTNPKLIARARRFAGFFLNEGLEDSGGPDALNYDADKNILRAPHNGSLGARPGLSDGEPTPYTWSAGMAVYGLPCVGLPGIENVEDLRDPDKARQMGLAMHERMGRGEVAVNLCVSTLVANAWLLTHDDKYKRWLLHYVDGWQSRASANGGLLPDNVGPSGQVGEYLDGAWHGGHYGWTWPHGFYNLQAAALVAAQACLLLTRDSHALDLARAQQDRIFDLGVQRNFEAESMSLKAHWAGQWCGLRRLTTGVETFLVPYRYDGHRWFDYQPMSPIYPTALWNMSGAEDDWKRIQALRKLEAYEWGDTHAFRTKEDAGHEQPWLEFLAGRNPNYPEQALQQAYGQLVWRLDRIRADDADLTRVSIHHWQEHNPVTTEALVQLTMGAPQPIYNGGLLVAPIRHFDADRKRPGLPPDVAALVTKMTKHEVSLTLINLGVTEPRCVLLLAGTFGEHAFGEVTFTAQHPASPYPAPAARYDYGPGEVMTPIPAPMFQRVLVNDSRMFVSLPPAKEVTLNVQLSRNVNAASHVDPFANS